MFILIGFFVEVLDRLRNSSDDVTDSLSFTINKCTKEEKLMLRDSLRELANKIESSI